MHVYKYMVIWSILFLQSISEVFMAKIIRPTLAIRCTQSNCRTLFEVAQIPEGKQQEVVCPNCGEHYIYPPVHDENSENNE